MADVKSPDNPSASNSPVPNDPQDAAANGNTVNNGTGANKRKRVGGSSARGVANLTPQQLERKRANDREAQRAIRERTKQQIDRLNDKIRELESAQPYRDLQAVISQKEAVEAENVDIKRQLAQFINIFRNYIPGAQALEERNNGPYHHDQHHPLPVPDWRAATADAPTYPLPPILDHNSPHVSNSAASPASASVRTYPPSTAPSIQPRGIWPPPGSSYDSNSRNIHPDLAYSHSDERLGVEFILDNNRPHSKPTNGVSPAPQSTQSPSPKQFVPSARKGPATCPLDAILLDAVAERQRLAAGGADSESVVGPRYPNFNALLNKNTPHWSHPLSRVFTDIMRTFPDLHTLPEQVAVVYIMFLVMRFEVEPTKENLELLPEWCRPSPSQLETAHPCWFDYLPWPRLRDAMVQTPTHSQPHFDQFFIPYTTSLSVNWPYRDSDVLLPSTFQATATSPNSSAAGAVQQAEEPAWRMNPVFETHIRNLENWSLGPAFRDVFPNWVETVRIAEARGGDR
ncbi:hypothetical protein FKW77_004808 [Venturia effusa]|uniref:BZIP domain-containing protein n=1 Tax=Venturia effusa TaxID=50376 RepID=A0A517LNW6_9PEZI|nr:hypothetical protein FKW77_004808 [Venturia effusa]